MRSIRVGTGRLNKFDCRLSNPTKSLPINYKVQESIYIITGPQAERSCMFLP